MHELTYFERRVNNSGAVLYMLKDDYLPPLLKPRKRYWNATAADGRYFVNQSSDYPALSEEAWLELAQIRDDWHEAQANMAAGLRANGQPRTVPQSVTEP